MPPNTQPGSYTLVKSDAGRLVDINSSNSATVTIPAQSSVAWERDATVLVRQKGTGKVTISGASGVTVSGAADTLATRQAQSVLTLLRLSVNNWLVYGDLDVPGSDASPAINEQTGTSYTLVLADQGKLIRLTNGSAITLTVPPNSSVAFPLGTQIMFEQGGAGQVTVTAGSGVTLNAANSEVVTTAQYAVGGIMKVAQDTWVAVGDLTTV